MVPLPCAEVRDALVPLRVVCWTVENLEVSSLRAKVASEHLQNLSANSRTSIQSERLARNSVVHRGVIDIGHRNKAKSPFVDDRVRIRQHVSGVAGLPSDNNLKDISNPRGRLWRALDPGMIAQVARGNIRDALCVEYEIFIGAGR